MSISLRDHKMLWGRAGARCAICRTPLATISEIGLASVIGEEAHIVARKQDGPRGNSPLSAEQRDSYSNLILLCPTHHATIDDIPNGPQEYTVERLHRIKAEHEAWVMAQDAFNAGLQLADEQWAALVDALDNRMAWDTWTKAARRAARAAATAASSGTRRGSAPDGPNAGRLARKSIKAGPLGLQQVSSVRAGASLLPLPGLSGAEQNLSRPSVTAGQPHPSNCPVNVHAKTTLTEPARTRRWQLSEAGTGVAGDP